MAILKSNSALVGCLLNNKFNFLSLIQDSSISINKNILNTKYLGKSLSEKTQFINPDIDFNISFVI